MNRSGSIRLPALVYLSAAFLGAATAAQLGETCLVSVLSRTPRAQSDGVWVLPNVPVNAGPVWVRATCIEGGSVRSGQSDLVTLPPQGVVQVPEISFDSPVPIPGRLEIMASVGSRAAAAQDPCQARQGPSMAGAVLSLTLVKPKVTLSEPVAIIATIRNELSEVIRVDLGKNHKQGLVFTVRDPLARVSEHRLPWPPEGGIYLPGEETLQTGQEYRQKLLLNEWYQPKEPGTYSFCGHAERSVADESGREIGTLAPAPLLIEILPRNEEVLRSVCEDLEKPARSPNVAVASQAALALSHVSDPVAIVFLRRVLLNGGPGAHYAIDGLGRIGGNLAVEALVDSFTELGGFERLQVQATLARFQASISDQSLRRRVDQVLAAKLDPWSGQPEGRDR